MGWKDKPTNIGGMELVSWLITGLFTGYRMACWLPIARLSSWRNPRQFGKSRSISMNKSHLVGGIQYLPLWKIWFLQLGSLFPIYGKKVPNHQPEIDGRFKWMSIPPDMVVLVLAFDPSQVLVRGVTVPATHELTIRLSDSKFVHHA
jgi:hypothetical protein